MRRSRGRPWAVWFLPAALLGGALFGCADRVPAKAELAVTLYDVPNELVRPILVWQDDASVVFSSDLDRGDGPYRSTRLEAAAGDELRALLPREEAPQRWSWPEEACIEVLALNDRGEPVAFSRWPARPGLCRELFPRLGERLLSSLEAAEEVDPPCLPMFSFDETDGQALFEGQAHCVYSGRQ